MNNYLVIRVLNQNEQKIISKLSLLKINIYNIYSINDDVYIKINSNDYPKIKKYLLVYDIRIVKTIGPLALKGIIKKYNYLIIGLLASFLFVFLSSFFIVDIKVIHEDNDLVDIIKDELSDYGIKKFSVKKSFSSLEKIKEKIRKKHLDKIDWLEINKVGMNYVVRVEERIINKKKANLNYCHIIALKNGIIKSMQVYRGQAITSLNDYVKKGDIIISGDITLNDEVRNHVCSDGKIFAEVWYTVNIKIPFTYDDEYYSGKKRKNIIIDYNDIDHKIFRDRLKNYKSSRKKIFDLLGIKIYIEDQMEIRKIKKIYSEKEAIEKAISLAKEKVLLKLNEDDKIIDEKVLQKNVVNSTMDIDIFIVAVEQIGEQVYIKEDDNNGI